MKEERVIYNCKQFHDMPTKHKPEPIIPCKQIVYTLLTLSHETVYNSKLRFPPSLSLVIISIRCFHLFSLFLTQKLQS